MTRFISVPDGQGGTTLVEAPPKVSKSKKKPDPVKAATSNKAAKLIEDYLNRIERLAEERAEIGRAIGEVYAEAKAMGFDTAALRSVLKMRTQGADTIAEAEAIRDLYASHIGLKAAIQ